MNRPRLSSFVFVLAGWLSLLAPTMPAYGQGGSTTSSLSGTVADASGAVVPGASVIVKNDATAAQFEAVSDAAGRFMVPALLPGTYTVTVSLIGFKTAIVSEVKVLAAIPREVKVVLEVGRLEETVVVQGSTELIQTQSATVAATLNSTQISQLPLLTHNTIDFLATLPGIDTTGTVRNSTVMGLRASATNITLDGINVQDNGYKSNEALFAYIRPNLDAVEAVTMSMANAGADSVGMGAVQIRFVTRSGTNKLQGSLYETLRNPALNSNYWFNIRDGLPKDNIKMHEFGGRVGGPVVIPGLFDGHDKVFFFVNYSEFRRPASTSRPRTIYTADAQNGLFTYNTTGGPRTVNLFALKDSKGVVQPWTMDPTVAKLLADIANATKQTGVITPSPSDPNFLRYTWQPAFVAKRKYPTMRLDVNATMKHRVSFTAWYQDFIDSPDVLNGADPRFPGFPSWGDDLSGRYQLSASLRSTLSSNMVNELRAGSSGGRIRFYPRVNLGDFTGPVANQDGFSLGLGNVDGATFTTGNNWRNSPSVTVEDTLNWIRGAHTMTMGGSITKIYYSTWSKTYAPSINFGIDSNDPALALFNSTNFPGGISSTAMGYARSLFALLTGRVTQIGGTSYLSDNGRYVYLGERTRKSSQLETGFYLQDTWRVRPPLTLTFGLRYEVQFPFKALSSAWTYSTMADLAGISGLDGSGNPNLFRPGTVGGKSTPQFYQFQNGSNAYNTDWNNLSPSVGVTYKLTTSGLLKRILGEDPVLRAGYSLAYTRDDLAQYSGIFENNPGAFVTTNRNMALNNLLAPGETLPVLFSQKSRLGPPPFDATPHFPLAGAITDTLRMIDPNYVVPYAHTFSGGVQRALTKNTVVEARYVGTRNKAGMVTNNYNEVALLENGFTDEFKLAMKNLQANIGAGRGNTFAYYGPSTGTSPLPIYLAHFTGIGSAGASDANNYVYNSKTNPGAQYFSNYYFYSPLYWVDPTVTGNYGPAGSSSNYGLFGRQSFRDNAAKAGLPANFWVMNPALLGGVNMTYNGRFTRYDSLQVEVRRRMSQGLLVSGSYVYADGNTDELLTLRQPRQLIRNTQVVPHTFKASWVYELPFGQGKKWGGNVSRGMNRLIGNWQFNGSTRVTLGQMFDFGGVQFVGFTADDLSKFLKVRQVYDPAAGKVRVYDLPDDIIQNTMKAFSFDPTATADGYPLGKPSGRYFAPASTGDCLEIFGGECQPRHVYVRGPNFYRLDMSLVKSIPITARIGSELRFEVFNVFDTVNFTINTAHTSTTLGSYEINSGYRDVSNALDPGGRLLQLAWRITW